MKEIRIVPVDTRPMPRWQNHRPLKRALIVIRPHEQVDMRPFAHHWPPVKLLEQFAVPAAIETHPSIGCYRSLQQPGSPPVIGGFCG